MNTEITRQNYGEEPLRVLQVSLQDTGSGGAVKVAWDLYRAYQKIGLRSWLAVGCKQSNDRNVFELSGAGYSGWFRCALTAAGILNPLIGKVRGAAWLQLFSLYAVSQPKRCRNFWRGYEDFDFPDTWHLLDTPPSKPDILHCHNLQGGWWFPGKAFFDLRAFPRLSAQVPTVLTIHDPWLLTGHCTHHFACKKWTTGCEKCPDLTIGPALLRDGTAYNWKRKKDIYSRSRFYIAAPSQWMMNEVKRSMLMEAAVECRVIPNGVHLSLFRPASRQAIRAELGLPENATILLFTAAGIRKGTYKDFPMLRRAITILGKEKIGRQILLIVLGENAPPEKIGQAVICFVPYERNPAMVAKYYQAADIYVHAARAESWCLTITEALACGTPVIATNVGGIPEQIEEGVTGFLVPAGDAATMAKRVVQLIEDNNLRFQMGQAARNSACRKFDFEQQVNAYVRWYREIVKCFRGPN